MKINKNQIGCLTLLVLFMLPLPVSAQLSTFSINGYAKYLSSTSRLPFVAKRLNDQLLHARVNADWYPSDQIRGELGLRFRGFYGGSVQYIPDFLGRIRSHHPFSRLDDVLWHTKKSIGYVQADRLWLDYSRGNLEITMGRQRIAWGTALVWNVIDLFNPQSILNFDYEEKPGADALRIQYYTGAVSRVEFSVRPGKNRRQTTAAGLCAVNLFEYDFYIIGGIRKDRWLLGGAWAGAVHKAGFRGEFLVSQAPKKGAPAVFPGLSYFGTSFFQSDKPVFSAVLSGDYTFSNSFYVHTEVLYNSNGKLKNAGIFYQQALQADMLSPARWSLFQQFSYNITPLVRGSLFGIFNPDDRSRVIVPQVTWSVITNLDFTLIGFFASGSKFTEWGDYGTSVFVRFKYSF